MANDILGGIINPKITSRNYVSLCLSYKEYSTTVIFTCKVSNLAEIRALLKTGKERNIPEYTGTRRNDAGMKGNGQES